jgi:hypothetical protein
MGQAKKILIIGKGNLSNGTAEYKDLMRKMIVKGLCMPTSDKDGGH